MQLRSITAIADIVTPGVKQFSGERLYSATGDVDNDGNVTGIAVSYVDRPSRADLAVQRGDVLFARMQGTEKILLVTEELECHLFSTGFCALRPKLGMADSNYLKHYLKLPVTQQEKDRLCSGATQKAITNDKISELLVPVPETLAQQKHIAIILDQAASIESMRAQQVATIDEYLRSAYFEIFGDPVANSRALLEKPIAEIATVTTGNTPSREVSAYYGDHIEWIKSDNINTPSHFLTKATESLSEAGLRVGRSVPAGSTLITCIAGSPSCIGNAALADRSVSFNQQINALTPKHGIEPEFIYATTLFSKARIQAASTNGMKGMVSKGALEQVRFILPPPDQREKFVAIFHKVMALTAKLESAASEASILYGSLAQRAFQGQLSGL